MPCNPCCERHGTSETCACLEQGVETIVIQTTPQKQQPLKRLSSGELEECWDKGKGKFTGIANAIMDEMIRINK